MKLFLFFSKNSFKIQVFSKRSFKIRKQALNIKWSTPILLMLDEWLKIYILELTMEECNHENRCNQDITDLIRNVAAEIVDIQTLLFTMYGIWSR